MIFEIQVVYLGERQYGDMRHNVGHSNCCDELSIEKSTPGMPYSIYVSQITSSHFINESGCVEVNDIEQDESFVRRICVIPGSHRVPREPYLDLHNLLVGTHFLSPFAKQLKISRNGQSEENCLLDHDDLAQSGDALERDNTTFAGDAEAVETITKLGYPAYLLSILGVWKILGVAAILAPRLQRLKEWAYAGFFFVASGAFISHVTMGDPFGEIFPAILLIALTIVSWAFRPESRKLG